MKGHEGDLVALVFFGRGFVAGVYPLLIDETCFLLAIDFDKAGWQEDALAPEQAHEDSELHQSLALRHFRKRSTNDSGAPARFRKHLHHKALAHFIRLTRLFWA